MSAAPSTPADVIIKLVQSIADQAESRGRMATQGSGQTAYTALVYTDLDLGLPQPTDIPKNAPSTLCDVPLALVQRLEIGWSDYNQYLADFVLGEKAADAMRSRMVRALSPDLRTAIGQLSKPGVRLWLASDCPELDELPWELLLSDPGQVGETQLLVARGTPPRQPRPPVPLSGKPRLALIGMPPFAPGALWAQLNALQNVDVVQLGGDPRQALRRAASEAFELVHLIADGVVTQAYEGTLYFHGGSGDRNLTVSELASQLLASSVAILSLTVPDYQSPDVMMLAGQKVPSAYRAYARLAVSDPTLPTIVAPLGPLDVLDQQSPSRLAAFWGEFYEKLGESSDVEEAMRSARNRVMHAPVALFLRHRNGRVFKRTSAEAPEAGADVALKAAEYSLTLRLTERLRTLEGMGGFSKNVTDLLDQQTGNLDQIAKQLDTWSRTGE